MSSLENIGQKLRSARVQQGFSLGQIYDRTKIPTANLEAIEAGDFGELPEPVYVASFIKRYADCVGLNGQALSAEFRGFVESLEDSGKHPFANLMGGSGNKSRSVAVHPAPVISPRLQRVSLEPPRPGFLKSIFWPAVLIVATLSCMLFVVLLMQSNSSKEDPAFISLRDSASRYRTGELSGSGLTAAPMEATTQQVAPQDTSCKIALTASQHVWVEVKSEKTGESKFTGSLEAGERRDFQDEQGLIVRAGNGGSLNVSFQGKHETFGAPGKALTRTFKARSTGGAPASSGETTASSSDSSGEERVKPRPAAVMPSTAKPAPKPQAATPKAPVNRLGDVPSRYIPGESLGGGRSIGVPYRYTEGRLDSE